MSLAVTTVTGTAVPLLWDNVDTDALVPAAPHKSILGGKNERLREILLYEFRFGPDGKPKADFVLNDPRFAGASILILGENFGCGSSRESAAWALKDYGFRAVIAKSFAEIFEQNAYKNHLVPAKVDAPTHAKLTEQIERNPTHSVTIDLQDLCIKVGSDLVGAFSIDEMGREMLMTGSDEFSLTTRYLADISATQKRLTLEYPWLADLPASHD